MKVKYVSRKISKIRWKPKNSFFFTGSYDDDENILTMWKFPTSTFKETENEEFFDEHDPQVVCSENFSGSVTDLKVISDELLLASSSLGSLSVYKYSTEPEKFHCFHAWKNIHYLKQNVAAISAISFKGQEIATVGEDGRLCIFSLNQMQKIKDMECSDMCSLTCVNYLRHQEIVAGNALGYLRVWDLRGPTETTNSMFHSRNQTGISCLNIHPTQSHILATGNDDGTLHIWDMRQNIQPTSILEGHSAAVSELLFHPTNPDFMFTCSVDGSVLQWNSVPMRNTYTPQHHMSTSTDTPTQTAGAKSSWLNCEANKYQLEIIAFYLQPGVCVNSLDFSGSTLLWATDNEAIHICSDVAI